MMTGGAMRIWPVLLAFLTALPAAARPHRVASLNLCTDEMLVALADPEDIASLSPLAHDPDLSTVADRAAGLPDNRNAAEELIRERVDLVLAETSAANATVAVLRRVGIRVETVPMVERLVEVAPIFTRIAGFLGQEDRGQALLDQMRAKLAAVPVPASRVRALFYESGGWSDGANTMLDDLLLAAGFANHAASLGYTGSIKLPLERVVAEPPDLLVTQRYRAGEISLAETWLDHPALASLAHRVAIPTKLAICGTPAIADAVTALAQMQTPSVAAR
jgi:iron complex transport system substrate-binding protein